MLPGDFNQVVDILRGVVRNVQRLTDARTPRWFRHVVEEKQQKLRLNEVQEFKTAAKALLAVINDRDMQQEPLPWSVLRRHAENVPLWLDRLVNKPAEYEKYKNRLLMSIDTFVQNADNSRVPLARPSTYRSTVAGLIMMVCGGVAGLAGCAPTRAYAEEPKQEDKVKDYPRNYQEFLKVTGLSEEKVDKLFGTGNIDDILKESEKAGAKIKRVVYDATTKTNNYETLLKDGCGKYVVFFGVNKKGFDTSLRGAIEFANTADLLKNQKNVEFIYFDMDIDPDFAKNDYLKFNKEQSVLMVPTLQLVSYDKTKEIIDSRKGAGLNAKSVLQATYNTVVNWIDPLFFKKPSDDGHIYKYNNTEKLQQIAKK